MRFWNRHKGTDDPCPYMVRLLNEAAEGRSSGFRKWYALAHAARCGPCGRFLHKLETLLEQLKNARAEDPSTEVTARLMARFNATSESPQEPGNSK